MKPKILFYVQSVFGLGHIKRAITLADYIKDFFEIIIVTEKKDISFPNYVRFLPEKRDHFRVGELLKLYDEFKPNGVIIEHFPFGRDDFLFEIIPLIRRVKQDSVKLFSSFRGILSRTDKSMKDRVKKFAPLFDMFFFHEEFGNPFLELSVKEFPFVRTGPILVKDIIFNGEKKGIVVSVGGGKDGDILLSKVLPLLDKIDEEVTVIKGPYSSYEVPTNFNCFNYVNDFREIISKSKLLISMAGAGTMSDILSTGVNALVFPRDSDPEQVRRANYYSERRFVRLIKDGIGEEMILDSIKSSLDQPISKKYFNGVSSILKGSLKAIIQDGPEEVLVKLNDVCNLSCKMCEQGKGNISQKNIFKILDSFKILGVKRVIFSGGEPLLHPDVLKIIEFASKSFEIELRTNGVLLDEGIMGGLLDIKRFSISIDSLNSEIHDSIRGVKGSWRKSVEAIKLVRRTLSDSWIHINVTVMKENFKTISGLVEFSKDIGVNSITFNLMKAYSKDAEIFLLDSDEMKILYSNIVPLILREGERIGMKVHFVPMPFDALAFDPLKAALFLENNDVSFDDFLKGEYGKGIYSKCYCIKPIFRAEIMADGTVLPCCGFINNNLSMGNVNETNFVNIWNSEKYINFRTSGKIPRVEECLKCSSYQYQNFKTLF